MAVALADVGDERFSSVLSRQTPAVQASVTEAISYMWRHYHLRYPKTAAIASRHKPAAE